MIGAENRVAIIKQVRGITAAMFVGLIQISSSFMLIIVFELSYSIAIK